MQRYRDRVHEWQVATVWFNDAPPAEANGVTLADLALRAGKFTDPMLVDVRTSTVYGLPRASWAAGKEAVVFRAVPLYDSPMLIAEAGALRIVPLSR